jgi:hypothetical protein
LALDLGLPDAVVLTILRSHESGENSVVGLAHSRRIGQQHLEKGQDWVGPVFAKRAEKPPPHLRAPRCSLVDLSLRLATSHREA